MEKKIGKYTISYSTCVYNDCYFYSTKTGEAGREEVINHIEKIHQNGKRVLVNPPIDKTKNITKLHYITKNGKRFRIQ